MSRCHEIHDNNHAQRHSYEMELWSTLARPWSTACGTCMAKPGVWVQHCLHVYLVCLMGIIAFAGSQYPWTDVFKSRFLARMMR